MRQNVPENGRSFELCAGNILFQFQDIEDRTPRLLEWSCIYFTTLLAKALFFSYTSFGPTCFRRVLIYKRRILHGLTERTCAYIPRTRRNRVFFICKRPSP